MEEMNGEYLSLVEKCIDFARQFMVLPAPIEVYFDDCPSQRFPTMDNAAEGYGNTLYFNKPWFTGEDRWGNQKDDIEFFVFHELRHLHQQHEISLAEHGQPLHESERTVALWKNGFQNYIRNKGGATQSANVSQEVEIDAYAYAVCLSNLLHAQDRTDLYFHAPKEAMALAMPRSEQYYSNLPELKRYVDKLKRQAGQLTVTKPGANAPCPCGSGKKFKKCCRGKGIYD